MGILRFHGYQASERVWSRVWHEGVQPLTRTRTRTRTRAIPYSFLFALCPALTLSDSVQLNYHLYTLPRPEALSHKYFISDDIREELQKRSETVHTIAPPGLGLPEELSGYHTLVPLEALGNDRRKFGNWFSSVYRATNSQDGATYVLRRIESRFSLFTLF